MSHEILFLIGGEYMRSDTYHFETAIMTYVNSRRYREEEEESQGQHNNTRGEECQRKRSSLFSRFRIRSKVKPDGRSEVVARSNN